MPSSPRPLVACLLLALALFTLGCQETVKVSDQDLQTIQYKELAALLESKQGKDVVLIDARKQTAYDAGHIPQAINIFLPDMVAGDARLAKAQHIIVYAGGWGDLISRAAGKRLMALGYKGVMDFRGGVEAWKAEGRLLAVNRDAPAGAPQEP